MEENKNWITWLFAVIGGFFAWLIVDVIIKNVRMYILRKRFEKAVANGIKQVFSEINENLKETDNNICSARDTQERIEETFKKIDKNEVEKEIEENKDELDKILSF